MKVEQIEKIQTGLTANYVPYWTVVQGLKEAMQNIAYGAIKSDKPAQLYFDQDECVWAMKDEYVGFEKRYLYIGESEQRDDEDGLGAFGEGWKIFLLIMARNKIQHLVKTVGFEFYGTLEPTPHDTEVLVINVIENDITQGTTVYANVDGDEWKKASESFAILKGIDHKYIQDNCLMPRSEVGLWVQGVRIEQEDDINPLKLHFSYNLRHRKLINRDRSHVNTEMAYAQIKQIVWRMSEADVNEFVLLAVSGNQSEDIQRGPDVPAYSGQEEQKNIWLNALAQLHATTPDRLVIPSYNTSINDEAKRMGLALLDTPKRWEYELTYLGIPRADDVVTEYYDIQEETDYEVTKENKSAISKAKTKLKNALNLSHVSQFPPFQYVAVIRNAVNEDTKMAHYDKNANVVYLLTDILEDEKKMVKHLLPELIAWKYDATSPQDFEQAYKEVIVRLLFK